MINTFLNNDLTDQIASIEEIINVTEASFEIDKIS